MVAYGGTASVLQANNQTKLISKGQVVYDAAKVAEKIKPWTGSYLAINGRKTQPLEIQWTSNDSGRGHGRSPASVIAVGWDGANVLGIPVGPADIPIVVKNGHLLTKADIPVSQGRLRWDLDATSEARRLKLFSSLKRSLIMLRLRHRCAKAGCALLRRCSPT